MYHYLPGDTILEQAPGTHSSPVPSLYTQSWIYASAGRLEMYGGGKIK